jgi:hypothetical protein
MISSLQIAYFAFGVLSLTLGLLLLRPARR